MALKFYMFQISNAANVMKCLKLAKNWWFICVHMMTNIILTSCDRNRNHSNVLFAKITQQKLNWLCRNISGDIENIPSVKFVGEDHNRHHICVAKMPMSNANTARNDLGLRQKCSNIWMKRTKLVAYTAATSARNSLQ